MASQSCFIMMAAMAALLNVSGTDSEVLLQKGAKELLPCEVEANGTVSIAAWNKEPAIYDTSYLISGGYKGGPWQKGGPGYDAGMYDIAKNFALIIKHVDTTDNGQFVCTATILDPRSYLTSKVNVSVFAPPRTPFPSIQKCPQNTTWTNKKCTFYISSPLNITCSVLEYFPNITIYFRRNSTRINSDQSREWENTDGTRNKEITITAEASDVPYTCVASDIPGSGDQEHVTYILLSALPDESTTGEYATFQPTDASDKIHDTLIGVIALVIIVAAAALIINIVLVNLRYRKRNIRGAVQCRTHGTSDEHVVFTSADERRLQLSIAITDELNKAEKSQPGTGLTDKMVLDLAKDLDDQKINSLGKELQLTAAEIGRIKSTNKMNDTHPEGTIMMLHSWRDSKTSCQQIPELAKALYAAGLGYNQHLTPRATEETELRKRLADHSRSEFSFESCKEKWARLV